MLRLHNSLTNKKEDFIPIKKWEVSIYTCWPTVYNYAHVWNFRAYLSADVLRRYLNFSWYKVRWVMNITDIDDKTIRDSKVKYPDLDPEKALKKFCLFYEEKLFEDLEILNIKKSDFYDNPRATDYIKEQQDLVVKIYDAGYAYESWWSIYFDLTKFNEEKTYWRLVNIDFDNFKSSWRIDNDEYEKEQIADFVLWKWKKAWEPHWDFNFNWKLLAWRPWWHLECSAMEHKILCLPFDIHNWWKDLKFPHHEDEIAQSYAWYGLIPNNYFVHNGHLLIEWEKMAKSKWNFYLVKDLINKWYWADVIRFVLVLNHYLLDFNLTDNWLNSARQNLEYIREFYSQLENNFFDEVEKDCRLIDNLRQDFTIAMDDDLNIPKAISHILKFIKDIREKTATNKKLAIELLDDLSKVFWVEFKSKKTNIPEEIISLAKKRNNAKLDKNYKLADELRKEIENKWFIIQDKNNSYELKAKS